MTQDLATRQILVCLTGGIAAYKVCEVVSKLVQRGAFVHVAMTPAATHFVGPTTFEALTSNPVQTTLWTPAPTQHSELSTQHSPVVAVRLQELFGLRETPRIAAGRIPLLLHLLAPNYRPVQITSDLQSFWANAYFQVRKDLKARYPKHSWPEDPLTAPPQAKGRPRR